MRLNQKDLRIKKLWEQGVRKKSEIARRIGYGACVQEGMERVTEGLIRLGIEEANKYEATRTT